MPLSISGFKLLLMGKVHSFGLVPRAQQFTRYQSSITFSGFLNALDGVASGEERIVFMTTNHIEKLDPALIRPGRVDVSELIDDASPDQARRLYLEFYSEDAPIPTLESYGDHLRQFVEEQIALGQRASMAALQGHFIQHNWDDALNTCGNLFSPKTIQPC
jgi:chaperone BCS1